MTTTAETAATATDKLNEIRARHAAATPGPYVWHGWGGRQRKAISIELCTTHSGMQIVMSFKRSGFDGAVPMFCTGDVSKRNNFAVGGILKPVVAFAHYPKDYKDEIRGIDHADATAIEKSWEDIDFLIAEVDRLKRVIERERTASATWIERIRQEIESRRAISKSRGPYEWNDDDYFKEFGAALDALESAIEKAKKDLHVTDFTDCPTTNADVQKAREGLPV